VPEGAFRGLVLGVLGDGRIVMNIVYITFLALLVWRCTAAVTPIIQGCSLTHSLTHSLTRSLACLLASLHCSLSTTLPLTQNATMGPKKSAGKKGAAPENGGEMVRLLLTHSLLTHSLTHSITQSLNQSFTNLLSNVIMCVCVCVCGAGRRCEGEDVHVDVPVAASATRYVYS
jgi:hypothetical protein